MSLPTLPTSTEANTQSNATITALTAAANTAFITSTTILILNAISNGLFQVEPYIVPYLSISTITTYFQGQGYTVTYPIFPPGPWIWCGAPAGFPEVLGNDWHNWSCSCGSNCAPRIQISWPPFPTFP